MLILEVRKNQGFTLSLENAFLEKPQGGSNWPPIFLGLTMKTPKLFQCCRIALFIINFEPISHNVLVFSWKSFNK